MNETKQESEKSTDQKTKVLPPIMNSSAFIYHGCVLTHILVNHAYEHFQEKCEVHQFTLTLKNELKLKHSPDHAYAQNLVVEKVHHDRTGLIFGQMDNGMLILMT